MKISAQLMQRATSAHQAGNLEEAEKAYLGLLKMDGKQADALRLLGALYVQMRRLPEAEEALRKAAKIQPGNAEIQNNLGLTLRNQGQKAEALRYYERAVRLKPDYLQALNNLGSSYQENGKLLEAAKTLERALLLVPGNAKTHYNLANVYREQGRPHDAIKHFSAALRLKPDYREAMVNLGLSFMEAGQKDVAIDWYQNALRAAPGDTQVMNNLGNFLRRAGRTEEARALFAKTVELKPDYAEAYVNYAMIFRDLNLLDEAQKNCEKALELKPDLAAAIANLGTLYQDRDNHEEALRHFDRALRLAPTMVDATWNKSLSLLALGRLEEGFKAYESGLGKTHLRGPYLTPEKRWDGAPFPGKRLLLWAEQGLGDSLHFIRYAKLCKERGGEVLVLCPPALRRLFRACPFIDQVAEGITEKDYDLHIPLLSLPFAFQTTLETIPAEIPYLFVMEEARAKWAPRFEGMKKPRVGLVWAGNPREHLLHAHMLDRRRSIDLDLFMPLLAQEKVTFVSLQKDGRADQIEKLGLGNKIVDFMGDVDDFMDTAALIENLDLVIAVDTSVAHLAGGLGKPVWILSRSDACWRWLRNRETNPWYPTARVFGQKTAGDWESVIEAIKQALDSSFS